MILPLRHFTSGNRELVFKMNEIVQVVNNTNRLIGDSFIKANRTEQGITIQLNMDAVAARIPRYENKGSSVFFAEVTATLTHDEIDEYTVQKIDESGTKDGTDIIIGRALGYEGHGTDGTDIRNYSPWFGVGAIVPISQHYDDTAGELKWFIDMPFVFIGKPADRSIDIDETYQRTMAVWK